MLTRVKIQALLLLLLTTSYLAACVFQPPDSRGLSLPTAHPSRHGTAAVTIVAPGTNTPASSAAYAPDSYRLQPGELILAAEEDDIPAILADDGLFVDAGAGSNEWADGELVIGVVVEEDARAYPVRLLSSHEIVNDVVGGKPLAITWCPLCYSALVFDRVLDRELTFGVSGYLFRNNLVMYDHQTNTLWSQVLAQGIRGAMRGKRLSLVPSLLVEWGQWKRQYPGTRVLSAAQIGKEADKVVDPYSGYYASEIAGLSGTLDDSRLAPKELVVGLVLGDNARAYSHSKLKEIQIINDQVGSLPVLLSYDSELETVWVYDRIVGEETFTFLMGDEPGSVRDEKTGSLWQMKTGTAIAGPLKGNKLQRLSAPLVYWFAWSAIYPETELFLSNAEE